MKGVYIFLAEGFEDMEALATADVLRRGRVDVKLVSITDEPFVISSHGVAVGVDLTYDEFESLEVNSSADSSDFFIFPGGMPGSSNLAGNKKLIAQMNKHYSNGGSVAAICAAPGLVLGQLEGIGDAEFTCFDGFEEIPLSKGARFVAKPAVRSGRIVTGRSAGYAVDFGLEILRAIKGDKAVSTVSSGLSLPCD